jgi:hypothetical protein
MGEPVCQFGGTYPNCWDEPNPPPPEPEPCYHSHGCGGGGGGTPPPPDDDPVECDPAFDPECEQPLKPADLEAIANATATFWKPLSQIPDQRAREACDQMAKSFNERLAAGAVFRGNTDTAPGERIEPHSGAHDESTNHIHFDPTFLDDAVSGTQDALRELANTALHEGAHALGKDHSDPVGAYYVEEPFSYLSPGTNSCLSW